MSARRSGGGFAALSKAINDLDKIQAKAGWEDSKTYEDGSKVADVAEYQEFGTTKIPPRPFMRPAIAENKGKWLNQLGEGARSCIRGETSASAVLESVAIGAAGDIGKAIQAVESPALDKKTIMRKGFEKPLIDTRLMFQSVTGIVEDKE